MHPEETAPRSGQRAYKSRLFSFLFGREENKDWTLSLYNALNGTEHQDSADITINTIEDVVYLGMKNDLSVLVSSAATMYRSLQLAEHQSTINPNLPVREFMYAGKLYDRILYMTRKNRYGTKLIGLPIPKLVVLYNGEVETEDDTTLHLADAFREEIRQNLMKADPGLTGERLEVEVDRLYAESDPDIAVRVRMININYGRNREILSKCRPLNEYAWFVARVREHNRPDAEGNRIGIEAAIDRALDEMPDDFVIKQLILGNRTEVKDMCLTEYDEKEAMELFREEGREEGLEEGRKEGRAEADARHAQEKKQYEEEIAQLRREMESLRRLAMA